MTEEEIEQAKQEALKNGFIKEHEDGSFSVTAKGYRELGLKKKPEIVK